ncbi:MAG: hypothetical protein V2A70_10000, partial [Candidatus Omnitrophota bacterium]
MMPFLQTQITRCLVESEDHTALKPLLVDQAVLPQIRTDMATMMFVDNKLALGDIAGFVKDQSIPLEVRRDIFEAQKAIISNYHMKISMLGSRSGSSEAELEQKRNALESDLGRVYTQVGTLFGDNDLDPVLRRDAVTILKANGVKMGLDVLTQHQDRLIPMVKTGDEASRDLAIDALVDIGAVDGLQSLRPVLQTVHQTITISNALKWMDVDRAFPAVSMPAQGANVDITTLLSFPKEQRNELLKMDNALVLAQLAELASLPKREWQPILVEGMNRATFYPQLSNGLTSHFEVGEDYVKSMEQAVGRANSRKVFRALLWHELTHSVLHQKGLTTGEDVDVLHELIGDFALGCGLQDIQQPGITATVQDFMGYQESLTEAQKDMAQFGTVSTSDSHVAARAQLALLEVKAYEQGMDLDYDVLLKLSFKMMDEVKAAGLNVNDIKFDPFVQELSRRYMAEVSPLLPQAPLVIQPQRLTPQEDPFGVKLVPMQQLLEKSSMMFNPTVSFGGFSSPLTRDMVSQLVMPQAANVEIPAILSSPVRRFNEGGITGFTTNAQVPELQLLQLQTMPAVPQASLPSMQNRQQEALRIVQESGVVTPVQYQQKLQAQGITIQARTARNDLQQLAQVGQLIPIKEGRNIVYVVDLAQGALAVKTSEPLQKIAKMTQTVPVEKIQPATKLNITRGAIIQKANDSSQVMVVHSVAPEKIQAVAINPRAQQKTVLVNIPEQKFNDYKVIDLTPLSSPVISPESMRALSQNISNLPQDRFIPATRDNIAINTILVPANNTKPLHVFGVDHEKNVVHALTVNEGRNTLRMVTIPSEQLQNYRIAQLDMPQALQLSSLTSPVTITSNQPVVPVIVRSVSDETIPSLILPYNNLSQDINVSPMAAEVFSSPLKALESPQELNVVLEGSKMHAPDSIFALVEIDRVFDKRLLAEKIEQGIVVPLKDHPGFAQSLIDLKIVNPESSVAFAGKEIYLVPVKENNLYVSDSTGDLHNRSIAIQPVPSQRKSSLILKGVGTREKLPFGMEKRSEDNIIRGGLIAETLNAEADKASALNQAVRDVLVVIPELPQDLFYTP